MSDWVRDFIWVPIVGTSVAIIGFLLRQIFGDLKKEITTRFDRLEKDREDDRRELHEWRKKMEDNLAKRVDERIRLVVPEMIDAHLDRNANKISDGLAKKILETIETMQTRRRSK